MKINMDTIVKLPIVLKLDNKYGDVFNDKKEFYQLIIDCLHEMTEDLEDDIEDLSILDVKLESSFHEEVIKILIGRFANGDMDAKKKLFEINLCLVVKFAKKFDGLCWSLEFDDLIDAGCLGLIRAIEKFDVNRDCKFSTYAVPWILQVIRRTIYNADRTIKLPIHVVESINRYNRVYRYLEFKLGREPIAYEMAEALDLEVSEVEELANIKYKFTDVVSFDKPIRDKDEENFVSGNVFGDFIVDEKVNLEDDVLNNILDQNHDLRNLLVESLAVLKEREREIIELRFGLTGEPPMTLEAIGHKFSVTHEAIRLREAKALRKLRDSSYSKRLKSYL